MSISQETIERAIAALAMHNPLNALLHGAPDTHHHKCPNGGCGLVWSHSRGELGTKEEFDAGHQCPKCGALQKDKCDPDGSDYRATYKLTEREVATLVAALQNRQEAIDDNRDDHEAIATQFGKFKALDANAIEHLTDKLLRA